MTTKWVFIAIVPGGQPWHREVDQTVETQEAITDDEVNRVESSLKYKCK
jgi:hypothetical protein